eukprot:CAMPEP_0197663186 /NCGR_PEP_ID=MMETSP1338-20131121/56424_1 /TAXON_ID=43686 ORGANISM="Pelagodinium beii, Strain RCC1491" /NCGR_SAMPLE_ID=MMETSP1338 /ASSEMBLY_ACC=CAM_ASM_000754 /LENGTH=501 /DNA_ID=CAMNT_0043241431 /DNA_START=62 /DNA_END=1567 /DNA_ORIENTATION=+
MEDTRPKLTCRTMFVLGAMNMIDCINVNLLTPYVDEMVSDFLHKGPEEPEVAHTVGLLIGLYSFCEVCFSIIWGTLADKIGRKPALLIGLGGSVIAPIMFGLGQSLSVVFAARALDGFFCGNVGVTRTYLGEIVDETNEARGFGFLATCFSVGLFVGPMLGGELVYPARWAPSLFAGTVFDEHPYLLPNLTYAIFAAIAWVIGALFLEETLPRGRRCCSRGEQEAPFRRQTSLTPGTDPIGAPTGFMLDEPEVTPRCESRCFPPTLIRCIAAYCAIGGCSACSSQLFILLVTVPQASGGFGLRPSEIGALQNVAALGLLLTQLVLYPKLTKRFGFLRIFLCGWMLNVVGYCLFPVYAIFADPEKYGFFRFVPLAFMQLVIAMGGGFMFPTAFAFINRASVGLERGKVNGVANSAGAMCRALLPPTAAVLFTLGSRSGLPLGRYMPIFVNFLAGSVVLAFAIPGLRLVNESSARKLRAPRPASSSTAHDSASRREPLVGIEA